MQIASTPSDTQSGALRHPDFYSSPDYVQGQLDKYLNRHNNFWGLKFRRIEELTSSLPKEKVLDLACSIGTFTLEFARKGSSCVGIDMSQESLEVGRQLTKEENCDGCRFVRADVTNQPFRSESFDLVSAVDVVEHFLDKPLDRMLTESFRLLRPGGHLVIQTFPTRYDYLFRNRYLRLLIWVAFWMPNPLLKKYIRFLDRTLVQILYRLLHRQTRDDFIRQAPHCNPQTEESMRDHLTRSGFEIQTLFSEDLYREFFSTTRGYRLLYRFFGRCDYSNRNIFALARKP